MLFPSLEHRNAYPSISFITGAKLFLQVTNSAIMDVAICPHELISDEKVTCNKMWPYTSFY